MRELWDAYSCIRDVDRCIFYSYFCTVDWPKEQITLQPGETESFRWLSEEEFIDLVNSERMIPGQMVRMRGFYEKMGYLTEEAQKA